MKNPRLYLFHLFIFALILFPSIVQSQKQLSDKIVAIVNDRIVLKSDVDAEVANYLRQAQVENREVSFSEELWYGALQSMVDNFVLLEKAEIDSIVVSEDLVDRQMDFRINQLVRQAGSERALENAFGQSLIQIRADFREQFREQLTAQMVQEEKISSIKITRPEVVEFFNSIPQNQLPLIPEQVGISQIVVIPEPLEDARIEAYETATALRDSVVNHGKDFEVMAHMYSDDVSASRGGTLPMMPMSDLVANYSAAASALEPGGISEVVETEFGFHVIRLDERSGDNIATSHILIEIDTEQVNESAAIEKLEALRDSVLNHNKSFDELARIYSEDEETRPFGGRISAPQTGRRLMAISQLDPALYRIVLLLNEEGEISEPRQYTLSDRRNRRAYRIVRLDRHIPEHVANLEDDFNQLSEFARQHKIEQEMTRWIDELRNEVYVEFMVPMPDSLDPEFGSEIESDIDV